jgi:hypothetical protein
VPPVRTVRPGDKLDPNYTFLTKVAKAYLPRVDVYGGVQGRLRETAARYRG